MIVRFGLDKIILTVNAGEQNEKPKSCFQNTNFRVGSDFKTMLLGSHFNSLL